MTTTQVGIRKNPYGINTSRLNKCMLSINVCNKQSIQDIIDAHNAGYPVFAICGTEICDIGFSYAKAGLRDLLTIIAPYIWGFTIRNEWNVSRTHPDTVRAENAWAAEVAIEFRVRFAISSTLSHTWLQFGSRQIGWIGTPGWPGLIDVYPGGLTDPAFPKLYTGEPAIIDVHLYTQAELDSDQPAEWLAAMLAWWTRGTMLYDNETYKVSPFKDAKYVVGEFGWKVNGGRSFALDAIQGINSEEFDDQILAQLYFCFCDKGLPTSQYYGLLNEQGSEKGNAIDNFNYALAQYSGQLPDPPVPPTPPIPPIPPIPPTPPPTDDGGYTLGFANYYREHPSIGRAASSLLYDNGPYGTFAFQGTASGGVLRWVEYTNRIYYCEPDA